MKQSEPNLKSLAQFHITTGLLKGHYFSANTLPVRIGRGGGCQIKLPDPGIWEWHVEVNVNQEHRFLVRCNPETTAMVNGGPIKQEAQLLRNGDQIEIGAVNLQFWLGNVRKKNHRPAENTIWVIVGILVLSEFILLLWLC